MVLPTVVLTLLKNLQNKQHARTPVMISPASKHVPIPAGIPVMVPPARVPAPVRVIFHARLRAPGHAGVPAQIPAGIRAVGILAGIPAR